MSDEIIMENLKAHTITLPCEQLTRRDQFAMAAMQGILSNPETECSFDIDEEVTAQQAVFIADALIEELDK